MHGGPDAFINLRYCVSLPVQTSDFALLQGEPCPVIWLFWCLSVRNAGRLFADPDVRKRGLHRMRDARTVHPDGV